LCGIYRIRSFPKARNVKGCLWKTSFSCIYKNVNSS